MTSSFEGNLVEWKVSDGDEVSEGDAIATIEAMKMESSIKAPKSGTISLQAKAGDRLTPETVIATID